MVYAGVAAQAAFDGALSYLLSKAYDEVIRFKENIQITTELKDLINEGEKCLATMEAYVEELLDEEISYDSIDYVFCRLNLLMEEIEEISLKIHKIKARR